MCRRTLIAPPRLAFLVDARCPFDVLALIVLRLKAFKSHERAIWNSCDSRCRSPSTLDGFPKNPMPTFSRRRKPWVNRMEQDMQSETSP